MNALEIKEIRKKLGLSQTEFGNMLGVGLRSVQNWESGNRNISKSAQKLLIAKLKHEQSSHEEANKTLIINGVECNLKECADLIANNFKEAKRVSKLFNLTIKNDNRDYLIEYLESKGFKVNS